MKKHYKVLAINSRGYKRWYSAYQESAKLATADVRVRFNLQRVIRTEQGMQNDPNKVGRFLFPEDRSF